MDIERDFPHSFERYTGPSADSIANLYETRHSCRKGIKQVFTVWAGQQLVGMSWMATINRWPQYVPDGTPNMSGFILQPWRGQGAGKLSLETRLKESTAHYNGHAWTEVRMHNKVSLRNVESAGFQQMHAFRQHGVMNGLFLYAPSMRGVA
jgi:L-amino acid N-acyltransferase YncA